MANTKISEYSAIAANNTEIDGINIAEGCAPSGINNAIRELMAQLKDFQAGTAGDNLTVGGNLSVTGAINLGSVLTVTSGGTGLSSVTAGDMLYASASNTLAKLAGAGATGSVLKSGTVAPSWGKVDMTADVSGTLPVANGGTGATTQSGAANNVLPTQTGQSGKFLTTNGTNVSWATVSGGGGGSVTSITAGNGLSGGTITSSGTISMALPGTLSKTSISEATALTHTHAVTFPVTSIKGQSSDTALEGDIILANLASFAKSLSANGYQKFPGGLIIQWGTGTIASATNSDVNLPITYPTAHVAAVGSFNDTAARTNNAFVFPKSTSQVTVANGMNASLTYWFISIGY